jgi:hypothetical protein
VDAEGFAECRIRQWQFLNRPDAKLGSSGAHCIGKAAGRTAHRILRSVNAADERCVPEKSRQCHSTAESDLHGSVFRSQL